MLKHKIMDYVKNNTFIVILATALCFLYLYFFGFRAVVEIEMETESPNSSFFKVYWANGDEVFIEDNMQKMLITSYRQNYSMFLTSLKDLRRLRIDPLEYAGVARLKKFRLAQLGYEDIELSNAETLSRLVPLNQMEPTSYSENGLALKSTGRDGQLEFKINPVRLNLFPLVHIVNLFLIFVGTLLMCRILAGLFKNDLFVPVCLLIVLVMIVTMASLTGLNVHPDEVAHLQAVLYYSEHFLPPAIDSKAAGETFSVYGVSRLSNYEFYYQLAGIFVRSMAPFHLPSTLDARLFGMFIFGVLVLYSVINKNFRVFMIPLLVTAQCWYLFSYTNSDAFALFVSLIMSYQVAFHGSMLNLFLTEKGNHNYWFNLIVFGGLFGLMLLIKTNFYFFILFLGLYMLWRIFSGEYPNRKQLWTRLIAISMIGICIYGVRVALDYRVNGPDPGVKLNEMAERHADPIYKPSTPLENKHIYVKLRDRGFSLDRILNKEQWGGKFFVSAFGAYGFTEFVASTTFYNLVRITGLIIFGMMTFGVLVNGPPSSQALLLIFAFSVAALLAALVWVSWAISFQPQGRYAAPILPMLGILFYHIRQFVHDRAVILLTIFIFLLGIYSFIFIGLHDIDKIAFLPNI